MWQRYSCLPISRLLSFAATPVAAAHRLLGEAITAGARLGVGISERWHIVTLAGFSWRSD